jgi:hypothetical protein
MKAPITRMRIQSSKNKSRNTFSELILCVAPVASLALVGWNSHCEQCPMVFDLFNHGTHKTLTQTIQTHSALYRFRHETISGVCTMLPA